MIIDYNVKKIPKKEDTALNELKTLVFYFIQWTWGLPVNLVGLIVFLWYAKVKKCPYQRFGYSFITYMPWNAGGLSLGLFIFMKDKHISKRWTYNTRIHEYGHTWQCLLLGPLYYPIIAIPSAVWCNFFGWFRKKYDVSYFSLYCEKWANAWGVRFSGLPMIDESEIKEEIARKKKSDIK